MRYHPQLLKQTGLKHATCLKRHPLAAARGLGGVGIDQANKQREATTRERQGFPGETPHRSLRQCCFTLTLAFVTLLLAACAQQMQKAHLRLPELRLAPAAFEQSISISQRLTLEQLPDAIGNTQVSNQRSLDALLEIESDAVRLAGFALGQRIITLSWDGEKFSSQRHALLPAEVDAGHILRDIQLVYWPAQTVRAALPEDWTLEDADSQRTLRFRGRPLVTVHYSATPRWVGRVELDNRLERYRLLIESSPAAGSQAGENK